MLQSENESLRDFEKIIDTYGEALMQLAYTYVKNKQQAEDIVQDVFVKAFEKRQDFRGDASYQTYLYRMTVNRCHDHFRSWSFRNLFFSDKFVEGRQTGLSVEGEVIYNSLSNALGQEIMDLPIKYREVIVFFYFKEYSAQQIAEILGVSINTVKTRLRRAKEQLKVKMVHEVGEQYEG
ncbi:sigma-70 family RNA polymerase sigma factor [Chryseomicrobium palamuruense]|uniref:Sigma-70 family RNA polymerase sigma factor n=1 Tax=Chryseomicrobium palamuruense TaxID=682973 RepID=A0ABV8V0G4_9BACL